MARILKQHESWSRALSRCAPLWTAPFSRMDRALVHEKVMRFVRSMDCARPFPPPPFRLSPPSAFFPTSGDHPPKQHRSLRLLRPPSRRRLLCSAALARAPMRQHRPTAPLSPPPAPPTHLHCFRPPCSAPFLRLRLQQQQSRPHCRRFLHPPSFPPPAPTTTKSSQFVAGIHGYRSTFARSEPNPCAHLPCFSRRLPPLPCSTASECEDTPFLPPASSLFRHCHQQPSLQPDVPIPPSPSQHSKLTPSPCSLSPSSPVPATSSLPNRARLQHQCHYQLRTFLGPITESPQEVMTAQFECDKES